MRQSYSIKFFWKNIVVDYYTGGGYYNFLTSEYINYIKNKNKLKLLLFRIKSVILLIKIVICGRKEWERYYFWVDNFKKPFYEKIGCKIYGHDWGYFNDKKIICINCYKLKSIDIISLDRINKIKRIKKGIK